MTYHCPGCGQRLRLWEEPDPAAVPYRTFMWVGLNCRCASCWHVMHTEAVETCLGCFPPQALEAA